LAATNGVISPRSGTKGGEWRQHDAGEGLAPRGHKPGVAALDAATMVIPFRDCFAQTSKSGMGRGRVETPEFDLCPATITAIAKRVELEVEGVRPTP